MQVTTCDECGAAHTVEGDCCAAGFGELAEQGALPLHWDVPPRPPHRGASPTVTIADLGDFAAESYAGRLDEWCRASLSAWGVDTMELRARRA